VNTVNINPPPTGDILVVDDTAVNLKVLTRILRAAGYQARSAATGELALRSVQTRHPALILLDIRMPGMDGFEVCRRLKKNVLTRNIPVIFLSGLADTADKVKGFELGAVDYITKPFHNKEVVARVRVHLALPSAQKRLANQIRELQQSDEQLARDIAEHKGVQEDLEAALKRLQTLNAEIATGQDEERHRIAYELHEQLGQEIVSLKMYLGLLDAQGLGNEAQASLLLAQSIVKVMLERIRNMSRNLRAPWLDALDTRGIFAALEIYCKQRANAAGWVLHFEAPPQPDRPPRDVELVCFRVVQDALANIARHANATEVWLNLRSSADGLQLSLHDNGMEFNAAGIRDRTDGQSLALTGLEERIRRAGGRLEIKSSAGGGTEFHAVFPQSVPRDQPQM
jgi:signal transduction histidine kinase